MKYWAGTFLIVLGFGLIKQFNPLNLYHVLGLILIIAGQDLK